MSGRLEVLGLLLMSGAWGFRDGFFVSPGPAWFWTILAAGFGCVAAGRRASAFPAGSARGRMEGAAIAAAILAVHMAMEIALPPVLARLHRIPAAAPILTALLRPIGVSAGVDGEGNLLVGAGAAAIAIAPTWELAALPMILRTIAAAALAHGVLACLRRDLPRIALAAALRVIVLVALIAAGARLSLAYEPAVTLLGFLPLGLTASATRGETARAGRRAPGLRAAAAAVALAAAAGICAGAWAGHRGPGDRKAGRVLIDESRSDWEWTRPAFDHSRYGQKTLYSYSLWRDWIGIHYDTRVIDEPPVESDLEKADVLIIKTPTAPYDPETIARIERFVRQGGGLYLIGDHTNLYGMSTVLNAVAAPYGLFFEHDDTFPLDHEGSDLFVPGRLAPHPVLRGLGPYPFETSCTLRVPWGAAPVMIGRRLGAEMMDYGHVNFFGNIRLDPSERFGLFVQAALVNHGEGSVAAFSDSTNFSTFSMLWPGRRELTLNMIDWLNRKRDSGGARLRLLALAGALAASVAAVLLLARAAPAARAAAAWGALGCFVLAANGIGAAETERMGRPEPRAAYRVAAFDAALGGPGLNPSSPVLSRAPGPSWRAFNAFFINAARSGIWPVVTHDLVGALRDREIVVLINPTRTPTRAEMHAIAAFLDRGGRLLVIDSILNARTAPAGILSPLGIPSAQVLLAAGPRAGTIPALTVPAVNGVSIRSIRGGGTAAWRDVGRGRVVFFSDGALFSDRGFGGVYVTPTRDQEEIHRGQQDLISLLMEPRGATERHDRD